MNKEKESKKMKNKITMLFCNSYLEQPENPKLHLIKTNQEKLKLKARIQTDQTLSIKMIFSLRLENLFKVSTLKWIFLKTLTTNQDPSSLKMAIIGLMK